MMVLFSLPPLLIMIPALQERRQQVVTKFKTLSVEASAITGIFDEQEVQHQIHTSRSVLGE